MKTSTERINEEAAKLPINVYMIEIQNMNQYFELVGKFANTTWALDFVKKCHFPASFVIQDAETRNTLLDTRNMSLREVKESFVNPNTGSILKAKR